jgi:tetratricopeptide (TPR) repeat protein
MIRTVLDYKGFGGFCVFSVHYIRFCLLLAVTVLTFNASCPSVWAESFNAAEDTQVFIAGFNAFQKQDYKKSVERMELIVRQYPNSQLYDTALFWLARSHFKLGNKDEAGRYMAQFLRQYPNSPLRSSIEEDLAVLAGEHTGTTVAAAPSVAVTPPAPPEVVPPPKVAAVVAPPEVPAPLPKAEVSATVPVAVATLPETAVPIQEEKVAIAALQAPVQPEIVAIPEPAAIIQPAPTPVEVTPQPVAAPVQKPAASAKTAAVKNTKRPSRQDTMRERAIADYKAVIDRHPGTSFAAAASEKLRSLGIDYAASPAVPSISPRISPESTTAQVLAFQIAQYAKGELNLSTPPSTAAAGEKTSVQFTVVNAGNGPDSFLLESAFPSEYSSGFSSQSRPDEPIGSTPVMAPGESFKGMLTLTLPATLVDGQVSRYSVKAVSALDRAASVTRELYLTASAPLLRAVVASDKTEASPGERVDYRFSLLNIGSAAARNVRLGIVCSPQYEVVEMRGASLQSAGSSELVASGLQVASGENREFTVSLRVNDDAPARQELFCRADVLNSDLNAKETFLSAMTAVRPVSSVALKGKPAPRTIIPGQVVDLPLVVANQGNFRDTFSLLPMLADGLKGEYFLDQNRDGIHQTGEPLVSTIGPLSPREEAAVIYRLTTSTSALDRSEVTAGTTVESETDRTKQASAMVRLLFARPLVELQIASTQGALLPGDISSLTMNCINKGSNLAKTLEVHTMLPPQMEVVSADPSPASTQDGILTWRFSELGAGEQRQVRLVFRIRPGVPAGTGLQVQNSLAYEDQLGNRY